VETGAPEEDAVSIFGDEAFRVMNQFSYTRILQAIVMDLINALPGNSSVNMVQYATIEEAVFRVRGDVTQRWVVVT
jgi:hypothetical protein